VLEGINVSLLRRLKSPNETKNSTSVSQIEDKTHKTHKTHWVENLLESVGHRLNENQATLRHTEAEKLVVCLEDVFSAKRWGEDTVFDLMSQLPKLKEVHFQGHANPFIGMPHFEKIIQKWHRDYKVACTLECDVETLPTHSLRLLEAPLHRVYLNVTALSPNYYHVITGHPPERLLEYQSFIQAFITRRWHQMKSQQLQTPFEVWLNIEVNQLTYKSMPHILHTAEAWGVQGVRFQNAHYYQHIKMNQNDETDFYLSPLYKSQTDVQAFLETLNPQSFRVAYELPVLLDDPRQQKLNRFCQAPFTQVTMDTAFNTTPCPKWELMELGTVKVWQGDFWNASHFQNARAIHHRAFSSRRVPAEIKHTPVPDACLNCTFNCPTHALNTIQNEYPF
jgi:hypothetical protein